MGYMHWTMTNATPSDDVNPVEAARAEYDSILSNLPTTAPEKSGAPFLIPTPDDFRLWLKGALDRLGVAEDFDMQAGVFPGCVAGFLGGRVELRLSEAEKIMRAIKQIEPQNEPSNKKT